MLNDVERDQGVLVLQGRLLPIFPIVQRCLPSVLLSYALNSYVKLAPPWLEQALCSLRFLSAPIIFSAGECLLSQR